MAWLGARPYYCDQSHWFAVGENAAPRSCPVCGSPSVRYTGDGDVPIFVLQVEDVQGYAREGDDDVDDEVYPFKELSVGDCRDIGCDLETPWEAVEALAEMALLEKASPS